MLLIYKKLPETEVEAILQEWRTSVAMLKKNTDSDHSDNEATECEQSQLHTFLTYSSIRMVLGSENSGTAIISSSAIDMRRRASSKFTI